MPWSGLKKTKPGQTNLAEVETISEVLKKASEILRNNSKFTCQVRSHSNKKNQKTWQSELILFGAFKYLSQQGTTKNNL